MNQASAVIIGGGASGAILAAELLRRDVSVRIVEPRGRLGQGVAYSTDLAAHRLNVRASRMSGRADDPGHFLRWLRLRQGSADEGTFAERRLYGEYLHELVGEARQEAGEASLEHVRERVVELRRADDGYRVMLSGGGSLPADHVVLALGNLTPGFKPELPLGLDPRRVIAEPWAPEALSGVAPSDRIVLLGAGLTAVDVALALDARGHRGRIVAVSRRGLLPRVQAAAQPPLKPTLPPPALRGLGRIRSLTRAVRAEVAQLLATGGDWHDAFEALRPLTPALWNSLSLTDRRRFLRHLQPYWDAHRHRMPAEAARVLERLRGEGRFRVMAARIERVSASLHGLRVSLTPRGARQGEVLRAERVINCTGPASMEQQTHPLLRQLLAEGLVRPDALGLGLDARPDGSLIGTEGVLSPGLSALGPLLKGVLWETISVPEIRLQAVALAERLARAAAGDRRRRAGLASRAAIVG